MEASDIDPYIITTIILYIYICMCIYIYIYRDKYIKKTYFQIILLNRNQSVQFSRNNNITTDN